MSALRICRQGTYFAVPFRAGNPLRHTWWCASVTSNSDSGLTNHAICRCSFSIRTVGLVLSHRQMYDHAIHLVGDGDLTA